MKEHTSLFISLMAFALSVLAFFVKGESNVENGVLALIGICATLIVGIHVVDEFRIRQIERKAHEIEKQTADFEKVRNNHSTIIHFALGLACISFQPKTALKEC